MCDVARGKALASDAGARVPAGPFARRPRRLLSVCGLISCSSYGTTLHSAERVTRTANMGSPPPSCHPQGRASLCGPVFLVIAMLLAPAHASERQSRLLGPVAITTAYAAEPDIVTAYVTGMARYRLASTQHSVAMALEPRVLRAEF